MPHLQHSSSCSPDLATKQLVGGPEDTENRGEEEEKEREREKRKEREVKPVMRNWGGAVLFVLLYIQKKTEKYG